MVWGLFPVDPQRGVQQYFIFTKGTYKVGRKDCDVVVQTDTSISRVHAEIIVDKMISQDPSESTSSGSSSSVRVIDRSKYGTVINKELGAEISRLKKDQEVMLKDGDCVTFGTGNATFRFSYVPLIFFLHSARSSRLNPVTKAKISAIGGHATYSWSPDCTHVLLENTSSVNNEIILAVLARKPIVLSSWIDMLVEKTICTEMPSCVSYTPNMALDGTSIKVVEPKFREKLLEGYNFVLGSSLKYIFEDHFRSLLEVVGANCVTTDEFCSSSQTSGDEVKNRFVLVTTAESTNKFNHFRELSSLSRAMDSKLIASILSGHMDATIIEQPPYTISSSHSTDETIVADSDVEKDTAISDHIDSAPKPQVVTENEHEENIVNTSNHLEDTRTYEVRENNASHSNIASEFTKILNTLNEDVDIMKRTKRHDEHHADRHENSDIIYSQDLIVRKNSTPSPLRSATKGVVNFKCFRKNETVSGNSFKSLIPFSKDPYKESDLGSDETSEYMRQEKKRKQLEAIAEDLFNNEKASKRATAGTSLQALYSGR